MKALSLDCEAIASVPTNEEKRAVWDAYWKREPVRVPVTLATNNRVALLDERFNPDGLTFEETFRDPEKMLLSTLRWQEVARMHYHRFCDQPAGLPEKWQVGIQFQNVSEAWFLGAPLEFRDGQVPDTRPYLASGDKRAVFEIDIDHPLQRDPYRRGLEFCERMSELARGMEYRGRPIEVSPYLPQGTDGPLTVAMNLRGPEFLTDLVLDPDYADALLDFITQAAITRAKAFLDHWDRKPEEAGLADDSIQLISTEMYVERVLPHHRRFYDVLDPERKRTRGIHLCGDAGRHFDVIHRELGVTSFDTGFPLDFARIRKELGPDVQILGGVEVSLLLQGTSGQVYERAKEILTGGVLEGRRFILREANNLPPATPAENLEAMYRAALDFGKYQ